MVGLVRHTFAQSIPAFGDCVQLCYDCWHSQTGVPAGGRWRHRCRRSNGDICSHTRGEGGDPRHTCGVCSADTKGTQTDVCWCSTLCVHQTEQNNMDTQNLSLFADNVDTGLICQELHVPARQWTLAERGAAWLPSQKV